MRAYTSPDKVFKSGQSSKTFLRHWGVHPRCSTTLNEASGAINAMKHWNTAGMVLVETDATHLHMSRQAQDLKLSQLSLPSQRNLVIFLLGGDVNDGQIDFSRKILFWIIKVAYKTLLRSLANKNLKIAFSILKLEDQSLCPYMFHRPCFSNNEMYKKVSQFFKWLW